MRFGLNCSQATTNLAYVRIRICAVAQRCSVLSNPPIEPQAILKLYFLRVVYQAAIMSQRELRLLGDGWLRRKQPKRQERTRERKAPNIFGRARRSDEIRAGLFAVLSGFYFIPAPADGKGIKWT